MNPGAIQVYEPVPSGKRSDHLTFLLLGALAVVVLFLYGPSWSMAVRAWSRPDYSHGPLIPLISLYFVWHMRKRLYLMSTSPNLAAGLPLLWLGILTLLLGRAASVLIVELTSILIVAAGLTVCILGWRYLRALALPIGYLAFMVPIPDLFLSEIHWPFQIFMAKAAAWALPFAGIPVFRRAQYLELPNIVLDVTGGCSGINYLISIVAIAIPLAHFTQASRMKKWLLIVGAILIGIGANIVRITLIGIWAYYQGAASVHGPRHMFQGIFVAVVGYIFLFVLALIHVSGRNLPENIGREVQASAQADTGKRMPRANVANAISLCVVSLLAAGVFMMLQQPKGIPMTIHQVDLPTNILGWQGRALDWGKEPFRVPGASAEVIRTYQRPGGVKMTMYLAYLDSQRQEKELVYYTFDDLYNASRPAMLQTEREPVAVSTAVIKGYGHTMSFVYWYDLDGRTVSNRFLVKVWTAVRSLLRGRTNGALILVRAESSSTQAGEELLGELMEFCRYLQPSVRELLARGTNGT